MIIGDSQAISGTSCFPFHWVSQLRVNIKLTLSTKLKVFNRDEWQENRQFVFFYCICSSHDSTFHTVAPHLDGFCDQQSRSKQIWIFPLRLASVTEGKFWTLF